MSIRYESKIHAMNTTNAASVDMKFGRHLRRETKMFSLIMEECFAVKSQKEHPVMAP